MAGFRWVIVFLLISTHTFGQVNRYIVFFKDKSNSPYSLDNPEAFLSAKSLARRTKQSIALNADDLPVNPGYISQVKSAGAQTYYSSRWMNCLLIQISADSLSQIQSLSFVAGVDLVAPGKKLLGGRATKSKYKASGTATAAVLQQFHQLGIDDMQNQGYHGENISVAVLDAGFSGVDSTAAFQGLFQNGQVKQHFNFVTNVTDVYQNCQDCDHGTEVLSIMAANGSGYTGGVAQANYYLFVTEDNATEYRVEEYNWLFAAERADSAGVDVVNTSLGYNLFDDPSMDYTYQDLDGKTTVIARAAAQAILRGIIVVCAAGNEGDSPWHYVTTPADAVGILACGAVDGGGSLAAFSSKGPTADNRIKPDVVALGLGASVISSGGTVVANSGTSFSSPLVTCLAVGVLQAFPELKSSDIYEAITRSADQALSPDNLEGYGIPHFSAIKTYLESPDFISVYPNPSATQSVQIDFKYVGNVTSISFYDVFGRLLSQRSVTVSLENNPIVYDVSALPGGLYIIKIDNASATKTVRFIKL